MKRRTAAVVLVALTQISAIDYGKLFAADGIQTAGDVLQIVLPAAAGVLTLTHRDSQGALQLGKSLALTIGVTYALKYTVDEERPNGGDQSFPSGHTSVSFAAAEFMRKRYGWAFGAPAYVAASFVGYSRVESKEHHPHDVLAGAGIGFLSSFALTKPYKGWSVSAGGCQTRFGLILNRHF